MSTFLIVSVLPVKAAKPPERDIARRVGPDLIALVQRGCKDASLNLNDLIEAHRSRPAELEAAVGQGAVQSLAFYRACLGGAGKGAGACDYFAGLAGSLEAGRGACRDLEAWAASARAAHAGDGTGVCRYLEAPGVLPEGAATAQACAFWGKALKDGDVAALCRFTTATIDKNPTPAASAACVKENAELSGRPEACAASPDPAGCRERAGLLAGLRGGARACERSPLCAAGARKDPAACLPYLSLARSEVCKLDWNGLAAESAKVKAALEAQGIRQSKARELEEADRKAKEAAAAYKEKKAREEVEKAKLAEAEKLRIKQELQRLKDEKNAKKKQFSKGQPMQDFASEVEKLKKAVEERGRSPANP